MRKTRRRGKVSLFEIHFRCSDGGETKGESEPCVVDERSGKKESCMNKSLDISTKSAFILCSHLLGLGLEGWGARGKKSISGKLFPFNPLLND